jgi:hypothetical protein
MGRSADCLPDSGNAKRALLIDVIDLADSQLAATWALRSREGLIRVDIAQGEAHLARKVVQVRADA